MMTQEFCLYFFFRMEHYFERFFFYAIHIKENKAIFCPSLVSKISVDLQRFQKCPNIAKYLSNQMQYQHISPFFVYFQFPIRTPILQGGVRGAI